MNDLISREVVISAVKRLSLGETDATRLAMRIGDYLKRVPPAQPEQTKGKWIHDGYDFPHGIDWIHCSICGKKGINVPADLTNFCPNCGADMRGEQNE